MQVTILKAVKKP